MPKKKVLAAAGSGAGSHDDPFGEFLPVLDIYGYNHRVVSCIEYNE